MILTSGAFDGIHAGHVRYLAQARQYLKPDELLICAVAPDAYIAHAKGRQPTWGQEDRLTAVKGLEDVDAAMLHGPSGVSDIIRHYLPRLLVKGTDWDGRIPEDVRRACDDVGTGMLFVDSGVTQHTSGSHVSIIRP